MNTKPHNLEPDDPEHRDTEPREPDELLSAAHDGELTVDEQALVARMLAESPDAQEQLSDLKELSALLSALDRVPAPVVLKQNILQAITPHPVAAAPIRQRPFLIWGAALASTAALLLVTLNWTNSFAPQAPNQAIVADTETDNRTQPHETKEHDRMLLEHVAMENSAGAPSMFAESGSAKKSANGPLMTADISPSAADGIQTAQADAALPSMRERYFEGIEFDANSPPQVGDEFATLLSQGELVALVKATVVDVDPMGDHTLVLMRGSQLELLSDGEVRTGESDVERQLGLPGQGELVIVYWQAPPAQVEQVRHEFNSLALESWDGFEDQTQQRSFRQLQMQPVPRDATLPGAINSARRRSENMLLRTDHPEDDESQLQRQRQASNWQRPPSPPLATLSADLADEQSKEFAELKEKLADKAAGRPDPAAQGGAQRKQESLPADAGSHLLQLEEKKLSQAESASTQRFAVRLSLSEYKRLQQRLLELPEASALVSKSRAMPPPEGNSPSAPMQPEPGKPDAAADKRPGAEPEATAAETSRVAGAAKAGAINEPFLFDEPGVTIILYTIPSPAAAEPASAAAQPAAPLSTPASEPSSTEPPTAPSPGTSD